VTARDAARALAGARVLAGVGLMAAPGRSARGWLGEPARSPAVQAVLRAMGVRDLVLGALTLHVVDHPGAGHRTVATAAVCDVVDCAAFLAARDHLPRAGGGAVILVAGTFAVAGLALAAALREGEGSAGGPVVPPITG